MYTEIRDEGVVVRDSDGQVIAPCQSSKDPLFVLYWAWVAAGNRPTVLETRHQAEESGPNE